MILDNPRTTMQLFLSNSVVHFKFVATPRTQPLLDRLQAFLHPCFRPEAPVDLPDLTVVLRPPEDAGGDLAGRCIHPTSIRVSNAPGFSLVVAIGEDEAGRRLAWDAEARVGYRIDTAQRSVEFFADDGGFIHLIELVRYYGLHAEQVRGTCVLHASAVADARTGVVTAIAGLKGAGKTTTLFSCIAAGGSHYFSGDKLLLDLRGGEVRARAWPDVPYIGAGTLWSHPHLARSLGLAEIAADRGIDPRRKFLVEPARFKEALPMAPLAEGMLGAVLLPEVDHEGGAREPRLSPQQVSEVLAVPGVFEWPHEFTIATWHGIVPAGAPGPRAASPQLLQRLAELPWRRRDGKPGGQTATASHPEVAS